jgi:ubiquinone/menaquinone biosynthesis C-methylase UbiE
MNERTFNPAGIARLEDPERLVWLPQQEVIDTLAVRPGMTIADIGAGTGYFAIPFGRAAGPSGRVHAVDFQSEMLEFLKGKLGDPEAPANIEPAGGSAEQTGLPDASCDVAFLGMVWHELDGHTAVLAEMERILRPGGRLAILDWRTDVTRPPGPPMEHRIAVARTENMLRSDDWTGIASANIGLYSYVTLAGRD